MSIDVPAAGGPILDTWGQSVANTINDHQDYIGWIEPAVGLQCTAVASAGTAIAVGGAVLVPFRVAGGMNLESYQFQNWATSAQSAEFGLYRDNGTTTWDREDGTQATWSDASPTSGPANVVALTSGTMHIPPGHWWLCIRNTHASNVLSISKVTGVVVKYHAYDSSVAALGATLDTSGFVASADLPFVWLVGEVAGGGAF